MLWHIVYSQVLVFKTPLVWRWGDRWLWTSFYSWFPPFLSDFEFRVFLRNITGEILRKSFPISPGARHLEYPVSSTLCTSVGVHITVSFAAFSDNFNSCFLVAPEKLVDDTNCSVKILIIVYHLDGKNIKDYMGPEIWKFFSFDWAHFLFYKPTNNKVRDDFLKIFWMLSKAYANVSKHFPNFSEDFRRLLNFSEDLRGISEDAST